MKVLRVTDSAGVQDEYPLNQVEVDVDLDGTLEITDPFWTERYVGGWTLEVVND